MESDEKPKLLRKEWTPADVKACRIKASQQPELSREEKAQRRKKALPDLIKLRDGNHEDSKRAVAEKLGISLPALLKWLDLIEGTATYAEAEQALEARKARGHGSKISDEQWQDIESLFFERRPEQWTAAEFTQAVKDELSFDFHEDHLSKKMRKWGWPPGGKRLFKPKDPEDFIP